VRTRDPRVASIFGVLACGAIGPALGNLPPSLEQSPIMGQLAAIGICFGSLLIVAGIVWRNRDDGLLIEQAGNALAAFGSLFYAIALTVTGNPIPDIALPVAYSIGITLGCTWRYFQIQLFIHDRKRLHKETL